MRRPYPLIITLVVTAIGLFMIATVIGSTIPKTEPYEELLSTVIALDDMVDEDLKLCYEDFRSLTDDRNYCLDQLDALVTSTPDPVHVAYCDGYMPPNYPEEYLIETSDDFLIVSLIQMARAVNLSSCWELDMKYSQAILASIFEAHELQRWYLDENHPDWEDVMKKYLNPDEVEEVSS